MKITEANKTFSQSFELDKTFVSVKGLLITADIEALAYNRGSQRIEINKDELFPDEYLTKLLFNGVTVPINERYQNLGNIDTGNKILKVDYKDTDVAGFPFSPYIVYIFLKCDKDDSK